MSDEKEHVQTWQIMVEANITVTAEDLQRALVQTQGVRLVAAQPVPGTGQLAETASE